MYYNFNFSVKKLNHYNFQLYNTLFSVKKLKFTHNDNLNYIIYKIIVNILIDKWKYQILVQCWTLLIL